MARLDLAEPVTGTGDRGGDDPTPGACVKWYSYLGLRVRLQQGELPLELDFGQRDREVGGR